MNESIHSISSQYPFDRVRTERNPGNFRLLAMTKIPMSNSIRVTTIRATTDILQKSNRQQQLFPAAALRICDHHLHSSRIIPKVYYTPDNEITRIYEHDWFCVSQAVQCYSQSISPAVANSSPKALLHRVVNGTDPCYCDIWVDTASIGNSSIHFGGVIAIGHDVLAVVRRVFVRMSPPDRNLKQFSGGSKSAPFTDEEKERFRGFGFEALGIGENYREDDTKKIEDLVRIKKTESNSDRLKSRIIELESPLSSQHQEQSAITKVVVGPQHINFGNHADHAFLGETAFHALTFLTKLPSSYISIQYLSEVFLGDVLESYPYRQDERCEGFDSIILVSTRKVNREKKVVLIAQAE